MTADRARSLLRDATSEEMRDAAFSFRASAAHMTQYKNARMYDLAHAALEAVAEGREGGAFDAASECTHPDEDARALLRTLAGRPE